jgi:HEAT repeat protein
MGGDVEDAGTLIAALSSAQSAERDEAAIALGMLRTVQAVSPLIARLQDADEDTDARALPALEQAHAEHGQPGIDALVRHAVAYAIERIKARA